MPEGLSESDLTELVRDVTQDPAYVERNAEYQLRRDRLRQRVPVRIPGLENLAVQHRSPKLREDAHAYKERFLSINPNIRCAAQADKAGAIAAAARMDTFCDRQFYRWRSQGVFDGMLYDMAAIGRGNAHLALNRDVMPLVPDPRDEDDPEAYLGRAKAVLAEFSAGERADLFIMENVEPENCYATPDKAVRFIASQVALNPLALAYERAGRKLKPEMMEVTELRSAVPEYGASTQPYVKTATLYIIETDEYIYHMLKGRQQAYGQTQDQLLGVYVNKFGVPCIFDLDGKRTGDPHVLYESDPLLIGLHGTAPIVNILGTMIMAGGVQAGQQKMKLVPVAGAEAAQEREANREQPALRLGKDGVIVPPPGYDLAPVGIEFSSDLLAAYTAILQEQERYGYPLILSQPQELAAKAGYDRALAQDAVQSALQFGFNHFGEMLVKAFGAEFTAIKNLDTSVSIRNLNPSERAKTVSRDVLEMIELAPEDVTEVDISVTFKATTAFVQVAQEEMGQRNIELGLMYRGEYLRDVRNIDDVERWRNLRSLDAIIELADQDALKDAQALRDAIRGLVSDEAIDLEGVRPLIEPGGNGTAPGASIPTGPGTAMPIVPPTPQEALGVQAPQGQTIA